MCTFCNIYQYLFFESVFLKCGFWILHLEVYKLLCLYESQRFSIYCIIFDLYFLSSLSYKNLMCLSLSPSCKPITSLMNSFIHYMCKNSIMWTKIYYVQLPLENVDLSVRFILHHTLWPLQIVSRKRLPRLVVLQKGTISGVLTVSSLFFEIYDFIKCRLVHGVLLSDYLRCHSRKEHKASL